MTMSPALRAAALACSVAPALLSQPRLDERLLLKDYVPLSLEQSIGLALGDVDGDGDLDMAVANGRPAGQQNRLYLNQGGGHFVDATVQLPVETTSTRVLAFGDLDGDGDQDLVYGNGTISTAANELLLNDGGGTFRTSAVDLGTGQTAAVALGDLDGDGDLDVVFANEGGLGQLNNLFLNDGPERFVNASDRFPFHREETTCVALGDVDGDGDLDVLFGNSPTLFGGAQNRLYRNDGTAHFTDATTSLPAHSERTFAMVLTDVDGDADLDLVVQNVNQDRLYLNDGAGTFADATAGRLPPTNGDVHAGDVDGDGDQDLVAGKSLLLNDGAGTFTDATAGRMPQGSLATDLQLGDLDGDGDLDVAYAAVLGQNSLLLNDGAGSFVDLAATRIPVDRDSAAAILAADVDGDGDVDLLIGNEDEPQASKQNPALPQRRLGRVHRRDREPAAGGQRGHQGLGRGRRGRRRRPRPGARQRPLEPALSGRRRRRLRRRDCAAAARLLRGHRGADAGRRRRRRRPRPGGGQQKRAQPPLPQRRHRHLHRRQ